MKLERNFFRQYIYALAVSVLLAFLLLTAVVIFFYFEFYILQNLNNLIPNEINWIRISQGLFFSFLTYISVSILYYFGTIEGKKTRFFSLQLFASFEPHEFTQ